MSHEHKLLLQILETQRRTMLDQLRSQERKLFLLETIVKTLKDLQDQLTALKQAVTDQSSLPAAHDFTPEVSLVSDAVSAINATTVAQGGTLTQSTAVV